MMRVGFTEVPRVANLSFRDFYEQYALQGKPVIIEGYGNRLFSGSPWNISTFERTCGGDCFSPYFSLANMCQTLKLR